MPWDAKQRAALVDSERAEARRAQRGQVRERLQRDPFGYLESKGIKLVKPQLAAWEALARRKTIALPWGRGVGKSYFLRLIAYMLVAKYDGQKMLPESPRTGIRIVWLMDTFKHFKDVHEKLLIEELESDWSFLGVRKGKGIDGTTLEVRFPGGSWMQPFPALEHTGKAALGLRADVVLVDECDDVPLSTYYTVARPWFTEPWSGKMRIVGGTPRKGRHGLLYALHERGEDPEQPRHESILATWRDAPEIVDPEEVEEARQETPPAIFAREWEVCFDSPEGLVYDNWDPDFHVRELTLSKAQWRMVYCGVDHGYVNPGVFLLGVLTGKENDDRREDTRRLWIVDEIYESGKDTDWWADRAREWRELEHVTSSGLSCYPIADARWFADPAEPKTIDMLRRKAGIKIEKGLNAVLPGIRQVGSLLNPYGSKDEGGDTRWARLYVSPKCVNLIREMGTYRRAKDPRDPDRYLEEIEPKQSDHAVDALRYMVAGIFGLANPRRHVVEGTSYG